MGTPPKLFKILISSTVHAATDYAATAWINLPIPKYFAEKLMTIDAICATKALGAFKNSPHLFLRHDLDMKPPEVRLTAKILNTMALIAAKPPSHPLYHEYRRAQLTKPQAHKGPMNAFFQPPVLETFCNFLDIQQPDTTILLTQTPKLCTPIITNKDKAMKINTRFESIERPGNSLL